MFKDRGLSDAWRGNLAVVDDCLLVLKLMDMGKMVGDRKSRLTQYKNALRRVSEYEAEMIERGMEFRK